MAGKTLETHIQQGTLFVVDLTEISLNEPTVSIHCYIDLAYPRENREEKNIKMINLFHTVENLCVELEC